MQGLNGVFAYVMGLTQVSETATCVNPYERRGWHPEMQGFLSAGLEWPDERAEWEGLKRLEEI
ncbi:MAG: hypothetical protein ACREII_05255, partial [Nitrospiraceae bacterium]